MEPQHAAILLAKCAAYDSRTIGRADAEAWAEALTHAGITLGQAIDAIGAHYAEQRDRVMPADVIRIVRATRRQRTAAAGQPDFPPGLTFDQEQRYRRAWFSLVGDGAEPDAATAAVDARFKITRPELRPRPVRELVAGAWAL